MTTDQPRTTEPNGGSHRMSDTTTAEDLRAQLAELVDELTRPMRHAEPYTMWVNRNRQRRLHVSDHPSLLDQLRHRRDPTSRPHDHSVRTVPGSRAPANLDAVERLRTIGTETTAWYRRLGANPLDQALRGLIDLAQHATDEELPQLVDDVRRWRAWAKMLGGWTAPPWRPHVPCPYCHRRDTIAVWLDRAVAGCRNDTCNAWWDELTIHHLAEHIRTVTDTEADGATTHEDAQKGAFEHRAAR